MTTKFEVQVHSNENGRVVVEAVMSGDYVDYETRGSRTLNFVDEDTHEIDAAVAAAIGELWIELDTIV